MSTVHSKRKAPPTAKKGLRQKKFNRTKELKIKKEVKSQLKSKKCIPVKKEPTEEQLPIKKDPTEEQLPVEKSIKKKTLKNKVHLNKQERRALKLTSKKHADLVKQLLPIWEVVRRDDTSKEKCFELIENIIKLSENKILDLCFAHDTARIIECAIHHGTEAQRWTVFGEIRKNLRLLAKSRYGKFVLIKLLKYGAKEHRLELVKLFRGHVARLVNHRLAAEVVDLFYNDYANASQRGELVRELFGNVHLLRQTTDNQVYSLANMLSTNADKKYIILSNLNTLLLSIVAKGLTKYSIVQHVLLEYLQFVSTMSSEKPNLIVGEPMDIDSTTAEAKTVDDSIRGKLLSLIEPLVEGGHLVPMLHTREGVRVALHILWFSPVSVRKSLVKGLKTCVSSIARDEHGHLFLIGLLDFVDDIVLLEKVVIKEILEDLELFCEHPEARKVLLYALSPRDSRNFSPQLQKSLFLAGDSNNFTRKLLGVRAYELRNSKLVPRLLQLGSDRLIDLFIGDDSLEGTYALRDRGRIVLLAELLIRSAPHHLDREKVLSSYHRDGSKTSIESAPKPNEVSAAPETPNKIQSLRTNLLTNFVHSILTPSFHPMALSTKSNLRTERDEERMKRHKMAVLQMEQKLAVSNKPKFEPFESGLDNETSDPADSSNQLPVPVNTPFLEQAEGQLFLRRLLQDGKEHNDFTLSRLILKNVPPSNLCAWTQCNRSCFALVNLYELGDEKVRKLLRSALSSALTDLSVSPLPGAKVLYKHLQSTIDTFG